MLNEKMRPERSIKGLGVWLFWTVVYWFRPRPKTIEAFLIKSVRTWWPWWTFKPHVFRNEDGKQWEVYLDEEPHYTEMRTIRLPVMIGESGKLVGVKLWDGILESNEIETEQT